ncbi:hypothetical protein, partial [Escherichia coli]
MQRAENDPDASFLFSRGKTSLFAVSASESRSARFSGANTVSSQSDHHSLSCIAMQRAENDPDASFLFSRG